MRGEEMEKQELINKTKETLAPFETEHVVQFVKTMTLKSIMGNPWIIGAILIIFFYAVIKRSKFVLLSLFTVISLMVLMRFTFHANGDELSLSSTLPFVFGGVAIGAVIIYFSFIKSE
jgi:hypothetical protein